MKVKKLLRGLISYVPVLKEIIPKTGTQGSNDPQHCLRTFEKHRDLLTDNGFGFPVACMGELGPGDSFGVGIAALLNGSEKYFGLDAIAHTNIEFNISIFEDLIKLYEAKNIIFSETQKHKIKLSIEQLNSPDSMLQYLAPWWTSEISKNTFDLIISTAVMEHVFPLEEVYRRIFDLLKPGGYCSHIIDYGAHEFSDCWFEHWCYSDWLWKILLHGRKYMINRMPHSYHLQCMLKAGFIIQNELVTKNSQSPKMNKIAPKIRKYFNNDDLSIQSAIVIIKKPQ
jgi:SAM-dependent methyltransferase